MSRSTILYAHRVPDNVLGWRWTDLMSSRKHVSYCGRGEVYRVLVRDPKPGEVPGYWAWWQADRQAFCFVFAKRAQVEVCFTYGAAAEAERGRGEVVNVVVEPLPEA